MTYSFIEKDAVLRYDGMSMPKYIELDESETDIENIKAIRITENWYYVEAVDKIFHLLYINLNSSK